MDDLVLLIDPAGKLCWVSAHAVADRLRNGWQPAKTDARIGRSSKTRLKTPTTKDNASNATKKAV
jgi:hypothetical protein